MKNKVLFTFLVCLGTFISAMAQTVPNSSFENWVSFTNYLNLTLTTPATLDTTTCQIPQNWTTSDEITNGNVFGHKVLVTQTANSYVGSSAIQLRTDTLSALLYGLPTGFPDPYPIDFVCPGFAVCGSFPINLTAFVSFGATFNPALLPGAGIPVNARYSKIGGYMKYTPVGGDSAYVVAILRQGTTVVATATYTRNTTDAGYTYFEAPFIYQNCLLPDTMVYTISSGNPYSLTGVALGNQSGLHIGSTLLADSIFLGDSIVYGISYPVNDSTHTIENTPVSIGVTANDSSCDNGPLTISAGGLSPKHGTITINGDSVVYTPAGNYSGMDTFDYYEAVGTGPVDSAQVTVRVVPYPAGINELGENKTRIYPNPASDKLYINASSTAVSELRVIDMLGNVMKVENFSGSTSVNVSGLSNGLYIIQFSGADGKMISSSRFTVIK
jgi:hypothetical protein